MTQFCLSRPTDLADCTPRPPLNLDTGKRWSRPVYPCVSPRDPSQAQLLDSILGLGALGLTIRAVLSTVGLILLLLLLLSFLMYDLLHRPMGSTLPRHRLLPTGQSQGAGEGPDEQALPTSKLLGFQDALLLLLLGLGLLMGACGMPIALLGLAFCLHPWA